MSEFFRDISLSDFQNFTYCLKATTSTAHKYYCPIFEKKIFSILIRLFLTQLVSKVGVKLQEITLYPFKFGRSKLTFDFLPRTWLIIIKENYFW